MAFPTDPLGTLVEIKPGSTWTDITADVKLSDRITITRGRATERARVDASKCTLTLNNKDGKYSPRNPLSTLYGTIGRNTPIRISVMAGPVALDLPGAKVGVAGGYATTPDNAALDITGDLDIRFDATLTNWITSGAGASTELCGKFNFTGGSKSWILMVRDGALRLEWSVDGTNILSATSTVDIAVPAHGHLAVRATLDVNNGASGNTTTFYTSDSITGTWTQLGNAIVQSGTTSIFNSTAALEVGTVSTLGFQVCAGRVHKFELRNGIAGTVVANPDFTAQASGTTSFTDSAGRTWSKAGNASITNRQTRFSGEVPAWPTRRGPSGQDAYVSLEAAGIQRRLMQGTKPLDSALRRRIPSGSPLAYWPMEDGQDSTQAYSPTVGVRAMKTTGINFGADDTLPGSSALPTLPAGSIVSGAVPAGSGGGWHVEMVYKLASVPASLTTFFQVYLSGSTVRRVMVRLSTTAIRIELRDSDDAVLATTDNTDATAISDFTGGWSRLQIFSTDAGGGVADFTARWIKIGGTSTWSAVASSLGTGNVTIATTNLVSASYDGFSLGHIAAFDTTSTLVYNNADHGFNGETTGTRMARLASEQALPVTVYGDLTTQELVGPQRPDVLLTLLQDAADVDGGILYEPRETTSLAYRDRAGLENQAIALALDRLAYGHIAPPFTPEPDDQTVRNDITVTRVGGSSGRATLDTGALSTLEPPNGVGLYDDAVTLNLYDDTRPEQQASWRLHLSTWDEDRVPAVSLRLHKATDLIPAALLLDIGDRWTVANPGLDFAPGGLDLLLQGQKEVLGVRTWTMDLTGSPAAPWNVAHVDDATYGWTDTEVSALAASYTSTATAISVATTSGPPWTTDHSDTPFELRVSGEDMTVVSIGTVVNLADDPLLLAGTISGWSGSNSAITYDTTIINTAHGADASIKCVPNGSSASGGVNSAVHSPVASVTAGASYTVCGWVYSPLGWSDLRTAVDWYDASNVFISSSTGSATVVPAATWTFLTQTFTAPALASRATTRGRWGSTPAATDISYWWALRLIADASVSTTSPQTMTVVRSRNNVVKAQASGAADSLAHPAYVAL
jgi:hypothetical protein